MDATDTIIRIGTWQPATTDRGAPLSRHLAPVINGTTTIGHLWRNASDDYRAILMTPGPDGCHSAHNHAAAPVSSDGIYRPTEHTDAHQFTTDLAALIAVARHHHQI